MMKRLTSILLALLMLVPAVMTIKQALGRCWAIGTA